MFQDPLFLPDEKLKPALFRFDTYQTYDLLAFKYLPPFIADAFANTFGPFFPNLERDLANNFNSLLFERFYPYNIPWCEDYVIKFANLLKPYCIPFEYLYTLKPLNEAYRANLAKGYESEYKPELTILGNSNYAPLTIGLEKPTTDTIIFSWLAYEPEEIAPQSIVRRWAVRYGTDFNKASLTIPLDRSFLACSLVVSGETAATVKEAIDKISKGFLFDNMDDLIEEFHSKIEIDDARRSVPVAAINQVSSNPSSTPGDPYPGSIEEFESEQDWVRITNSPVIISKQFALIPDWYFWVGVSFANNNYWDNEIAIDISEDWGKPIVWSYNTAIDNYGEYLYITNTFRNSTFQLVELDLFPFLLLQQIYGKDWEDTEVEPSVGYYFAYYHMCVPSHVNLMVRQIDISQTSTAQEIIKTAVTSGSFIDPTTVLNLSQDMQSWLIANTLAPQSEAVILLLKDQKANEIKD